MQTQQLLKKVHRIQIITNRMVDEILAGEYHSAFKGQGMEFDEVREYQVGDDIRSIDWNVTARTGVPHIKSFREERELTIYFLVDISQSLGFGSFEKTKGELAIEVAAVLSFAALKNNDKVGLILFSDRIEKFLPARKGRHVVLRIIREMASTRPSGQGTDLSLALDYFAKVQRRKAVVFLVSDFLNSDYQSSLKRVQSRHDLIAVNSSDPRESHIPDLGLIELEDAETGERMLIDSRSSQWQKLFQRKKQEQEKKREEFFQRLGIDELSIATDRDYLKDIHKLFRQRSLRFK